MTDAYEQDRVNLMNQLMETLRVTAIPDCDAARLQATAMWQRAQALRGALAANAPVHYLMAGDSLIEAAASVAALINHMCQGRDRAQLLTDIKLARLEVMVSDLQWQVAKAHAV